ncbi:MAG TPA: MFS transporter, partial [Micromonosporaceae bacterium]
MRLGAYLVDRRPLAIPDFRRIWLSAAIAAVGGSFSLIAVPAQLFTITGSSAAVGAAAAVSLGTLMVAALWTGVLADVLDRRRLLVAANTGLGLTYLGLWGHAVLGLRSVAVLLVLVGVQGLSFGASMTLMGAVVPRLVPTELLVAANSLSSLARNTGAIVGPMLAGVLIPVVGLDTLYLFDALALAVVLWASGRLPALPPLLGQAGSPYRGGRGQLWPPTVMLRQLGQGFGYLLGQPVLAAIVAVDLAAMAFALPVALYPELAERGFGGPAGGGLALGVLFAAYPAGVLTAGVLSGSLRRIRRHGAWMASAAALWGVCVVLLGLTSQLWLAAVALLAGGAVNFVLSTFRNAISQAHTDDALLGRIQGALTVVLIGGPQVANLWHGFGGAVLGARWAVVLGGLLAV